MVADELDDEGSQGRKLLLFLYGFLSHGAHDHP